MIFISYGVGSACCSFTFPGNAKAFSSRTGNDTVPTLFFVLFYGLLRDCRSFVVSEVFNV